MKTKIILKNVGCRTKAFSEGLFIKIIPKPYIEIIKKLGYIDVRSDKKFMTEEEKLILDIYLTYSKYLNIPNFKGLENIQIISKNYVKTRNGDDYYSINIRDAPEIKIKKLQWDKLNIEDKKINRWH